MATFYEILGVREQSNPAEIELAYQTLANNKLNSDFESSITIEMAYSVLINPLSRLSYNEELAQAHRPRPALTAIPSNPAPAKQIISPSVNSAIDLGAFMFGIGCMVALLVVIIL